MIIMKCQYDTGSMYGCIPACERPAIYVVTYHNGSSGPFRLRTCHRHLSTVLGRVYPGVDGVDRITGEE